MQSVKEESRRRTLRGAVVVLDCEKTKEKKFILKS